MDGGRRRTIAARDEARDIALGPLGVDRALLIDQLLHQPPRRDDRGGAGAELERVDPAVLLRPLGELEMRAFLRDEMHVPESGGRDQYKHPPHTNQGSGCGWTDTGMVGGPGGMFFSRLPTKRKTYTAPATRRASAAIGSGLIVAINSPDKLQCRICRI